MLNVWRAYAKINLTLEVLGKRQDGFHEIATVMQCVDLADELVFEPADGVIVDCDDPGIPQGKNLVFTALRMLSISGGANQGAHVTVSKNIPLAAGLGGGSSDAAAALLGLNQLWRLGFPRSRLDPIAAELGSDVPFFLHGGTALAQGRGEVVKPLPDVQPLWLVLTTPPIHTETKTATLYGMVTPSMFTSGEATQRLVLAIEAGEELSSGRLFQNTFEQVAREAFPGMEEYWSRFADAGAPSVHLCGSGPTLFTPVSGPEEGERLQDQCMALGLDACLVRTVAAPV